MLNKERDVPYCSVSKEMIQNCKPEFNLSALKRFHKFVTERYRIHILKDIKVQKAPWTEDPILAKFKFTNVRREHDTSSRWLIENIVNSDASLEDKIYRCILYRLYNTPLAGDLLKMSAPNLTSYLDSCVLTLKRLTKENPKVRLFTNAYKTGGCKTGLLSSVKDYIGADLNTAPILVVRDLMSRKFHKELLACTTQREVYDLLWHLPGFGKFMAYQVFVDLTYIPEFPFSENEFTVAGPGCECGLKFLVEDFSGLSAEELLFWLRDNLTEEFNRNGLVFNPEEIFVDLPKHDRCLNVMSLENLMCEFSKYYSIYTGIRKSTRCKYKPKCN